MSSSTGSGVSQAVSSFFFSFKRSFGKSGCHPVEIAILEKDEGLLFRQGKLPNPFLYSKRRAINSERKSIQIKRKFRDECDWRRMSLVCALLWKATPCTLCQKCGNSLGLCNSCFCLWKKVLEQNSRVALYLLLLACFWAALLTDRPFRKDKKARGGILKNHLGIHSFDDFLWFSRKSKFLKKFSSCSPEQTIQQAAALDGWRDQVS